MSHLYRNLNFWMGCCNHHAVDIYGTPAYCRKCAPHLFLASADDVNGPLRDYLDLRYRLSRPVSSQRSYGSAQADQLREGCRNRNTHDGSDALTIKQETHP